MRNNVKILAEEGFEFVQGAIYEIDGSLYMAITYYLGGIERNNFVSLANGSMYFGPNSASVEKELLADTIKSSNMSIRRIYDSVVISSNDN